MWDVADADILCEKLLESARDATIDLAWGWMVSSSQVDGMIRLTTVEHQVKSETIVIFDGRSILCVRKIDLVFNNTEKREEEDGECDS